MTKRAFNSLGRKMSTAMITLILLALVLAFVLNLPSLLHGFRTDMTRQSLVLADLTAASLVAAVDFQDKEAAGEILNLYERIPTVLGAAVYLPDGAPFAVYGDPPPPGPADEPVTEASLDEVVVLTPVKGATRATLAVRFSMHQQWAVLARYAVVSVLILAVVFALCLRLAAYFRRKLADPLAELTTAIQEIGKRKAYFQRVNYVSDDEVGLLVAEFNAMLQKIATRDEELRNHRESLEQLVDERTRQLRESRLELLKINRTLVAEMKKRAKAEMIREEVERINRHDLKSALSLVIGYPELLLRDGSLAPEQEQHVRRIRAAGYRMLDMVTNHLDMFKMEKGLYAISWKPVDLVETICSLEEELAPLLGRTGAKLSIRLEDGEITGEERFEVRGEEPLIRAMLRNLIQNAVEASKEGDVVTVSMERGARPKISVANPAPVPKEIRHRMFDRYVTFGKENGTGLGTYFAALVARTHGANISMRTSDTSGTVISVTFREEPGELSQ